MPSSPRPRMTRAGFTRLAAAAVAVLTMTSCSGSASDGETGGSGTTSNPATSDAGSAPRGRGPAGEWTVSSPEAHDIDAGRLEAAKTYAFADGRNTQSVVIVRGGEIVAEWYAPGADADSWVASWSVAKSFVGAAIGVAIDEGLIPSVGEPMTTYYPEWGARRRRTSPCATCSRCSPGWTGTSPTTPQR